MTYTTKVLALTLLTTLAVSIYATTGSSCPKKEGTQQTNNSCNDKGCCGKKKGPNKTCQCE